MSPFNKENDKCIPRHTQRPVLLEAGICSFLLLPRHTTQLDTRFARYPEASLAGGWDLVSPILTLSHFFLLQTLIWMSSGGSKFRNVSILLILSIVFAESAELLKRVITLFATKHKHNFESFLAGYVVSLFHLAWLVHLQPAQNMCIFINPLL